MVDKKRVCSRGCGELPNPFAPIRAPAGVDVRKVLDALGVKYREVDARPGLFEHEILEVKPMEVPKGAVFFLNYTYGEKDG